MEIVGETAYKEAGPLPLLAKGNEKTEAERRRWRRKNPPPSPLEHFLHILPSLPNVVRFFLIIISPPSRYLDPAVGDPAGRPFFLLGFSLLSPASTKELRSLLTG